MVEIFSFLFAIGVGFGLSCLIFGNLLDKSNNIGDSRGSKYDYKAFVNYTARKDRLNKEEKASFCNRYYERVDNPDAEPKGSQRVRRLTEEEINEYKRVAAEQKAARVALQQEAFRTTEDEFKIWESQQPSHNLSGVFKPLNEN